MEERNYDDIIDLPHHVSKKHPQMTRMNRAAQFAPFAALTGYDDAVTEEARLTGAKAELTEEQLADLNNKMAYLKDNIDLEAEIEITYFKPDTKKAGGEYVTIRGIVHDIDDVECVITLTNKKKIPMSDILYIDGDIFKSYDFQ